MDNAYKSNILTTERTFGHSIIRWEIKNVDLALWQNKLNIKTPEFCIKIPHSRNTKWKFVLKMEPSNQNLFNENNIAFQCKEKGSDVLGILSKGDLKCDHFHDVKDNSDNLYSNVAKNVESRLSLKNLILYLQRSSCDEGPDIVFVDCKVSYTSIRGQRNFSLQKEHFFSKNFKYGFNIGSIYDFEQDIEHNPGIIKFACDIIVSDTDNNEIYDEKISIDLYSLSEDLQWIFNQQMLCDIDINVQGKCVKAHKAMLYSNNISFEYSNKDANILEISDIKYTEFLKVLEYIYSHDLKTVFEKPNTSIYDSAIKMKLEDLVSHYAPEKVNIQTDIIISKLTYSWVIDNFTKQSERISSSIVKYSDGDLAIQLNLYPYGIDEGSKYVAISVECINGNISDNFSLQCTVFGSNESLNVWKTLQKDKECSVIKDEKFILREEVFKYLNKDTLRIGLIVKTYKEKESLIVTEPCIPFLYSQKKSFENMKNGMLHLRQSEKYADVTFKIGKEKIKAHKFILSARSLYFLKHIEDSDSISLSHISPDIFNILLDYMYCASFNVQDIDKVIEVYKASEEFIVPRLQEKCSRFLQNNIRLDNFSPILKLAETYNDTYLKSIAQEFINANDNLLKKQVMLEEKHANVLLYENRKFPSYETSTELKTDAVFVFKRNENSVEGYKFEVAQKNLNRNIFQTGEIYEYFCDISAKGTVLEELLSKSREDLYMNGAKKSENTMAIMRLLDKSESAQSDEHRHKNIPLKTNFGNGIDLSSCNAEKMETKLKVVDQEMLNVITDSKDRVRETHSPSKNASIKDVCLATSDVKNVNYDENAVKGN